MGARRGQALPLKMCASCALHGSGQMVSSSPPCPHVILTQVLEDMRTVLQVLGQPASQVVLLRQLLDPTAGVEPAKLPPAFKALLGTFATERAGRLHLDNQLLAQALQVRAQPRHSFEALTRVSIGLQGVHAAAATQKRKGVEGTGDWTGQGGRTRV
jgi:hypothetical protein